MSYTAQSIANAAALETALEHGGGIAMTPDGVMAAKDAFLVLYDDTTHSYLAEVVVAGNGLGDNEKAASTELVATDLIKFTSTADATAITVENFDFFA